MGREIPWRLSTRRAGRASRRPGVLLRSGVREAIGGRGRGGGRREGEGEGEGKGGHNVGNMAISGQQEKNVKKGIRERREEHQHASCEVEKAAIDRAQNPAHLPAVTKNSQQYPGAAEEWAFSRMP